MPDITGRLRREGFRRGFAGNRHWLAIGLLTWGYQRVRKMASREPELVAREELRPGDRIIISHGRETIDIEHE